MTTIKADKQALIRQYHALAHKLGMTDDQRAAFLSAWGSTSSKELTAWQLIEVCRALANKPADIKADTWRKRVMASIFGWFKLIHKEVDADYVKAVAARAARYDNFNDIPVDKLRSIYNTFTHKSKIFTDTGEIINHEYDNLQFRN